MEREPAESIGEAIVALSERFQAAGQGHVTQNIASLSEDEQRTLVEQLRTIDPVRVNRLFTRSRDFVAPSGGVFGPLKNVASLTGTPPEQREAWRARGLAEIAKGRVGTLLLAGGQGTRLGFDHPKGMYNIGLPSGRSLFQLQAERLLKLQEVAAASAGTASATIYWYVMTSPATDAETREYFESRGNFGLQAEQIFFFCQGMLPCVSHVGKILMESRSRVAMAPNGNGGLYEGLASSGALAHMEEKGVELIPQVCVCPLSYYSPSSPRTISLCCMCLLTNSGRCWSLLAVLRGQCVGQDCGPCLRWILCRA